uniref:Polyprotein n=1 Tax=Solanum tuberosum TaxID=4113 RepID=M1CC41_SOLTU
MRSEIGLKPKNQKQQLKGLRRWNFGLKKSNLNLQQQRYKEEFMDSKVRKHRCNREENEAAAEFGPKVQTFLCITCLLSLLL